MPLRPMMNGAMVQGDVSAISCGSPRVDGDDIVVDEVTIETTLESDVLFRLYLDNEPIRSVQPPTDFEEGMVTTSVRFSGAATLVSAGTYDVGVEAEDAILGFGAQPAIASCGQVTISGGIGNGGEAEFAGIGTTTLLMAGSSVAGLGVASFLVT